MKTAILAPPATVVEPQTKDEEQGSGCSRRCPSPDLPDQRSRSPRKNALLPNLQGQRPPRDWHAQWTRGT